MTTHPAPTTIHDVLASIEDPDHSPFFFVGGGHAEAAVKVADCCDENQDSGPAWDWVQDGTIIGHRNAQCGGCGSQGVGWVKTGAMPLPDNEADHKQFLTDLLAEAVAEATGVETEQLADRRSGEMLAVIPVLDGLLPEGAPLPVHPGLPTQMVATAARNEPLVAVTGARCIDAYHQLGITNTRRVLSARKAVVERLAVAQTRLPSGFALVVLDGWRSAQLQTDLVNHYESVHGGSVAGYVADPDSITMRPPHVVGAAVDLTLSFHGQPLALGSAYDEFSPAAHLDAFEGSDSTVRRLRRLMAEAMLAAGFAPYPLEWWHWSYGDDIWAAYYGRQALYDVFVHGHVDSD